MATAKKPQSTTRAGVRMLSSGLHVFISHDTRDRRLAEAFGKLLTSVSAGMIKVFRSSDTSGTEGVDLGDDWYRRLMRELKSTSYVVCLFTEQSLDRPWILFEAGVAKGRRSRVVGVALGVSVTQVSAGPFSQFQNMDDSEANLTKLVHQLADVLVLKLDSDVVKKQVTRFKAVEAKTLAEPLLGTHLSKALNGHYNLIRFLLEFDKGGGSFTSPTPSPLSWAEVGGRPSTPPCTWNRSAFSKGVGASSESQQRARSSCSLRHSRRRISPRLSRKAPNIVLHLSSAARL